MEISNISTISNYSGLALLRTTPRPVACPVHYPTFMLGMYVYILPCLIVLGLIGNSLAFLVFCRQRRECSGDRIELLSCLALADNFYLLTNIFSRFLPTIAKYHSQPALFWSIYTRPVAYAVASSGQMIASYTMVLVTGHRYALICHPLRVDQCMTTRKTAVALTATVVFCIGYNIPRLFELSVEIRGSTCLKEEFPTLVRTPLGDSFLYTVIYLNILRFIFRGIIPVVGQFVLTILVVRRLRARPEVMATDRRNMTLSQVLVVVAIVFLLCQIPSWISSVLNSIKRLLDLKNTDLNNFHSYFVVTTNMLLTINSATNFIIYVLCGSAFKRTLKELLHLCWIRRGGKVKQNVYFVNV